MEKISQICQSSALAALAALVDRVGFPGPRGTACYHTFVIPEERLQRKLHDDRRFLDHRE